MSGDCDTPEQAMLELLTWTWRLASAPQLKEGLELFGHPCADLAGRLGRFDADRWTHSATVVVCQIPLGGPVITARPAEDDLDFEAISWQTQQRWTRAKPKPVRVYWATQRAAQWTGGSGGTLRQPYQIEHDLSVTSVFLSRSRIHPETPACWRSEDLLRRFDEPRLHGIVPDALLMGPDGSNRVAIEVMGRYSAERLRRFHRGCRQNRLAYELW